MWNGTLHLDGSAGIQVTASLPELTNGRLGERQLGGALLCGWPYQEVLDRGKVRPRPPYFWSSLTRRLERVIQGWQIRRVAKKYYNKDGKKR